MAEKLQVFIVDDSALQRRALAEALSQDEGIDVWDYAANGRIAVERLQKDTPDVVILDIEMPEMNGLEALRHIRKKHPRLPVIIYSSKAEAGAAVTIEALTLGADDYLCKPSGSEGVWASISTIRSELIPKIRAICGRGLAGSPAAAASKVPQRKGPAPKVRVVAVAASTGGPQALTALLGGLESGLRSSFLIVQHMPPVFTQLLAKRLRSTTGQRVAEASGGEALSPGGIWIAPGGSHMVVKKEGVDSSIHLHQDPPENSVRPSADVLFRSVAEAYGSRALAVVLTGMGKDGLKGCEAIRKAGGAVLAQDEESSVVWSMPGGVARAGLADAVLPIDRLAREILRRF